MTSLLIENEEVQETAETMITSVQKTARKVWLASLGLWGLGYDQANKFATQSQELLARAEKRGVKVEEMANEQISELQTQFRTRINRGEEQLQTVRKDVTNRVETMVAKVRPATSEQVEDLIEKIEEVEPTVVMVEPVAGYSDLTAKQIIALLEELPEAKLVEVKAFELANDNRVTVLREVERLMEKEEVA